MQGTVGGDGEHTIPADASLIGWCFKTDYLDSSGNVVGSTTGELGTGAVTGAIPEGAVRHVTSHYPCPQQRAGIWGRPAVSQHGLFGQIFFTIAGPIVFDPTPGSANRYGTMRIRARTPEEANAIAWGLLNTGTASSFADPRILDAYLTEFVPLANGDVHLEVASRGSQVEEFTLDLNGVDSYAFLGDGVSTSFQDGVWAVASTNIASSALEFGASSGEWYENACEILFRADDMTSPTTEEYTFKYQVP